MRALAIYLTLSSIAARPGQPQAIADGSSARRVIAVDARRAGVSRLGDPAPLVDDWDVSSIETFTWQVSPRGLASFQRQGWSVMLNGQTVDLALFGTRSLNRLPVIPSQIDSIEFISAPGIYGGNFADGGLVRIHAHRPEPGLSFRGYGMTANETGDPGPYAFTELATPNVHRIGSDAAAALSYAGEGGYVDLSAATGEHFILDLLTRDRNNSISSGDEFPIMKFNAASLRAGLDGSNGKHEAFLGYSELRDYFFLKPFGREVPVESKLTYLGADGSIEVGGGVDLDYRLAYSANELDKHPNSLDLDFDWRLSRLAADVEASRRRAAYDATVAVGLERVWADTNYELTEDAYTKGKLYGELRYRLSDRVRPRLGAFVTATDDDLGLNTFLALRWRPGSRHAVEAVVSYAERLPEEDDRIWFWFRRGYLFLPDNGVEVTIEGDLDKNRQFSADVSWSVEIGPATSARLGGYYRTFSDLLLEEQFFQFNPVDASFFGPVRVVAGQGGDIAGTDIALRSAIVPRVDLRAYYRYQDIVGGNDLFNGVWNAVANHRFRTTVDYTPLDGLSLWGMLDYRGPSRWVDYRDVGAQTDGVYSSRLDDMLALQLAVQKWFWDRRLRINIQLRNLLNDTVQHHPIGAAYDLTFAIQGELLLDSIWKPN